MQKALYDADTLERALRAYEHRYKLSSAELYELRHSDDPRVAEVSRFDRHTWASLYRDYRRLSQHDLADTPGHLSG